MGEVYEVILDAADIWATQLWRLIGSMTNGPLENERWWQEWKEVRQFIEDKARR